MSNTINISRPITSVVLVNEWNIVRTIRVLGTESKKHNNALFAILNNSLKEESELAESKSHELATHLKNLDKECESLKWYQIFAKIGIRIKKNEASYDKWGNDKTVENYFFNNERANKNATEKMLQYLDKNGFIVSQCTRNNNEIRTVFHKFI